MSKGVKLSAPWIELYRQIQALFKEDSEVQVKFNEDDMVIKVYVESQDKAEALTQILPAEKEFGNITIGIRVIPANKLKRSPEEILSKAFDGNDAVNYIRTVQDPALSNTMTFVVCKKEVVQYYNDDISDIHGLRSTLYEDIAKNLIDLNGVYFCTDNE